MYNILGILLILVSADVFIENGLIEEKIKEI